MVLPSQDETWAYTKEGMQGGHGVIVCDALGCSKILRLGCDSGHALREFVSLYINRH